MSALRELYQEVILDHNRKPRNFRTLPAANRRAEGNNPLCGDRIALDLDVAEGVIRDVGFQGTGCAISRAAASLMTASIRGKTEAEAEKLFDGFRRMLTGDGSEAGIGPGLGVFAGVREFPARIKCATLPWHTLHAALAGKPEPVSTE